jgi:hypothetical protein
MALLATRLATEIDAPRTALAGGCLTADFVFTSPSNQT